ncbi:unnamed protein product [Rotaria magnacalcarata]|nr:unnamed protein product [Rotaria magnacalcarata]CAF2155341.1 unnamed protein product [Rotaria magnacalcarata]CAF4293286.1 unnamed protein product [Rotaria magnacalcarata]CAF4317236.1 unnamed protein product [Rotaria magnacalcarata]
MPLTLHFYRLGYVSPATPTYCTWWTAFEYTLFASSEYLLATISIQRHMLIFNGHILRMRWMRNLLHHLPLALCLIYPAIFYLFAIILYPCDGIQWDFTNNLCGYADCYLLFNKVLGTYDMAVNNGMPMVIDILANVTLIIRVVRQKHRLQRSQMWRQQRRMIMQLFGLSGLFLVAWIPCIVVLLVQILDDPNFLAQVQTDYFLDLIDIEYLFLPWVCLGFLPELTKWIKTLFRCQQARNMVGITQTFR